MSVISPFVCSTRNLLAQGFRSLPVILGSAVLVLGLAQGNFNLLFFFVGMCILAPTVTLGTNLLWELVFSNTPWWLTVPEVLWKVPAGDAAACAIYPTGGVVPPTIVNAVPSFWLTMMAFFTVYLFANAKMLYDKQAESNAPKVAVEARKSQAMMAMVIVVLFGLIVTVLRYGMSGCETAIGVLLSWVIGGLLGNYWYTFLRACGLGRLDDLFGISNRILPYMSGEDSDPTVCAPA